MSDSVSFVPLSNQYGDQVLWLDSHYQTKSVSIAKANLFGTNYNEVPIGTIIAKCYDGYHRPCAYDLADGAVAGASAVVVGEDKNAFVDQFTVGDWLFYAGAVFPARITAINKSTKTLTLDRNITVADDGALHVDPSVSVATLQADTSVNTFTFENATDDLAFRVGDVVTIEGVSGARNVTAIDAGADTITVDGAAGTVSAGARIINTPRGQYKPSSKTVYLDYGNGVEPANVLMPTRKHGEVVEATCKGLFPDAKTAMQPMIEFNTDTRS